jgi:ubiquinone/menaquinone biosynthesis C-methylase UbiE
VFGQKVKMKLQSNLIYPALVWASYGGVHVGGFQLGLEKILKTNQAKRSHILYSNSNTSPSEIAEAVIDKTQAVTVPPVLDNKKQKLAQKKRELLSLLGSAVPSIEGVGGVGRGFDPVLACPKSKAPLTYSSRGPLIIAGATSASGRKLEFTSSPSQSQPNNTGLTTTDTYEGRTDTYYNLLTSVEDKKEKRQQQARDRDNDTSDSDGSNVKSKSGNNNSMNLIQSLTNNARVLIPPPVRSALVTYGVLSDEEYIPMRDLFTSPSVSFAYERGWRQGFAAAGFPGADKEFDLTMEYFDPVLRAAPVSKTTTVVDMSCATGLFTRRFASSGRFNRVLGCDYSESMLTEARRRISSDRTLSQTILQENETQLELVQLDVAKIPMQNASVECLHAGAAMHCWPEIKEGLEEIYRVLIPGGRFFATTFLSRYFSSVQAVEGGKTGPTMQAFNYFESKEELRDMMIAAGFSPDKVFIEVLGAACVVIRCQK